MVMVLGYAPDLFPNAQANAAAMPFHHFPVTLDYCPPSDQARVSPRVSLGQELPGHYHIRFQLPDLPGHLVPCYAFSPHLC